MALHLRVVGAIASRLGPSTTRAFGIHGGQIGRAPDNDWVLPDEERYVSGYHASVSLQQGHWVVTDRSSNGTFINGSVKPIPSHQSYPLSDGDVLRIGDYEIVVRITPETDFPPHESLPHTDDGGSGAFATMTHGDIGAELDLPGLFAEPPPPGSPMAEARAAPAGTEPAQPVPDGTLSGADVARLLTAEDKAEPAPAVPPLAAPVDIPRALNTVPKPSEAAVNQALTPAVHLLLRSAGLDPQHVASADPAQVLTLAGQLLREMTLGLSAALRSADHTHDNANSTAIRRVSPLAAADGVNESLARLLAPRASRSAGSVDTVRDGFTTLQKHDQARQQALADALQVYVSLFSPAVLAQQFDRVLARAATPHASPRTKYWDMYADLYRVLAQPNDAGMPHAFAEHYARAYHAARDEGDPAEATANRRMPAL